MADASSARTKSKTAPPPPPGSDARRQLEHAIVEAAETPRPTAIAAPRTHPPTRPPRPTGAVPIVDPAGARDAAARGIPDGDIGSPRSGRVTSSGAVRSPAATGSSGAIAAPRATASQSIAQSIVPPAAAAAIATPRPAPTTQPPPMAGAPRARTPSQAPAIGGEPRAKSPSQAPLVIESTLPQAPARTKAATLPPMTAAARAKPTQPPPLPPGARAKGTTKPPPVPGSPNASGSFAPPGSDRGTGPRAAMTGSGPVSGDRATGPRAAMSGAVPVASGGSTNASGASTSASGGSASASGALPAGAPPVGPYSTGPVPIGEFEDAGTVLEKDKLRIAHGQATIKRDASNAILGIPEQPLTVVGAPPVEMLLTESAAQIQRGDATSIDPQTHRFERGDPTNMSRPDITLGSTPPVAKAGRLRTVAQLRRQRGLLGDVRYVSTALFGVRRVRRELGELEAKQVTRQAEQRRYMVTLGRTAIISDGFDHPALNTAREQLGSVEDERARHTGQVVAADQELQRVKRDREAAAKQYVTDLAAVDGELAELDKRLEPLKKDQVAVQKRGAELREQLRRLERQIADTTASLVSVKGPKQDPAAIQAELATLKADRVAVQRDEPKIAAELDALNPRIAALESKRSDSTKRRAELVKREEEDQRRAEELLTAIGAKRKVMDRAAADAEALRDKILFELGERLYVDRPDDLGPQLAPIDAIDLEIGEADRRVMELREILSSIDKAKLWRGIAVIAAFILAVGGFAAWLIYELA